MEGKYKLLDEKVGLTLSLFLKNTVFQNIF